MKLVIGGAFQGKLNFAKKMTGKETGWADGAAVSKEELSACSGKRFNEHGWINGMLPIVEEIKLDTSNTIHIGQSVDGTYAVSIDWCTGTAGGGSHPSVWDEPVRDYKEAVRQGIRLLERQYNKAECWSVSDRSNYNPKVIRSLKEKLLELKRKYTQPRQLSLF